MIKFYPMSTLLFLLVAALTTNTLLFTEAQHCRPYGHFVGFSPPPGRCNPTVSDCCVEGRVYSAFHCSPPLSSEGWTRAVLTLNNFEADGPTECDNIPHSDDELLVSVSTGWYAGGKRCGKQIVIKAPNGSTATATVVDHCDSSWGCDEKRGFEAPCRPNVIDASRAVWRRLGVPETKGAEMNVTWSDA